MKFIHLFGNGGHWVPAKCQALYWAAVNTIHKIPI